MKTKVLIIGFGSAGERHAYILKKKFKIRNLSVITNRKIGLITLKKTQDIKNFNPDIVVVSNSTSKHLKTIKYIEKNFKNKIILVEKPLIDKFKKFYALKNRYFVAYQLRFHPVLIHLKKFLRNQEVLNTNIICNSFLPSWRNRDYKRSYSSNKNKGGGVLLDLSHEIDYLQWLFPNLEYNYFFQKKISSLKIKSEDIAIINGCDLRNRMQFQINLNYFSRIPKRLIMVDTNNFSFVGDLTNNFYKIKIKNKSVTKNFKKYDQSYLTYLMYKSIFKKNYKNLCSFKSGLKILKTLEKLKTIS